jgi:hypothetical protein
LRPTVKGLPSAVDFWRLAGFQNLLPKDTCNNK